jgi:large subunit ribosomal protein L31
MKPDIHPKYYPSARITCACGSTWTTGATLPEIHLDLCSNCHPFYTGEQRIVDTAGRVDRFKMRLAQKRDISKKEKPRKEKFVVIEDEAPVKTLAMAATAEAKPAAQLLVPGRSSVKAEPEPEYTKRTLVESETGLKPMDDDDDDEERKRRNAARKQARP